jgi:hypothetical protein
MLFFGFILGCHQQRGRGRGDKDALFWITTMTLVCVDCHEIGFFVL